MKVVFLSHKFYPYIGGIETISEFLANAFVEKGAQVKMITWTQEESDKNFPFDIIRNPSLKEIYKIFKWADVIFENNPVLRMSWVNLLTRKPIVVALHTWLSENNQVNRQYRIKAAWLKMATKVIAVSNALRLKSYKDAIVIQNAYNSKLFRDKCPEAEKRGFVFLGRLVSDKGADQAVNLLASLKETIPNNDFELEIIGSGPELESLTVLAADKGVEAQVVFTGALTGEKLVDHLSKRKYILVPSAWEEPFGLVVLEGMASGCIPIVSSGGGLPEAVGNAGVIFERNNYNDFLLKTEALIADEKLQEKLKHNAKDHLLNHREEIIAERYFNVLKDALKQH